MISSYFNNLLSQPIRCVDDSDIKKDCSDNSLYFYYFLTYLSINLNEVDAFAAQIDYRDNRKIAVISFYFYNLLYRLFINLYKIYSLFNHARRYGSSCNVINPAISTFWEY